MDRMRPSDNQLMERLAGGDASALEVLVRRWERSVARVLAGLAGPRGDVEDLCQEVFLRVYSARARYRGTGAFSTWLHAIARNVARDAQRRRGAFRKLLEGVGNGNHRDTPQAETVPVPEARLRGEETRRGIETALAQLPTKLREVLVLKHFGELTFEEVARVTGLRASTVKSRLRVALTELGKELKRVGIDGEDISHEL